MCDVNNENRDSSEDIVYIQNNCSILTLVCILQTFDSLYIETTFLGQNGYLYLPFTNTLLRKGCVNVLMCKSA